MLLVFAYLVIPAVIGRLFSDSLSGRLTIGYTVGILVSLLGVAISYEHSTGPIVVGLLGACLLLSLAVIAVQRAPHSGTRLAQLMGGLLAISGTLWGFAQVDVHSDHSHDHVEHAVMDHSHADHHADHADHSDALSEDPLTQLEQGVRMVRALDSEGLLVLAGLTRNAPPFIRMEADDRLRTLAGDDAPAYDPIAGPDTEEAWLSWARAPGVDWREHAADLELP